MPDPINHTTPEPDPKNELSVEEAPASPFDAEASFTGSAADIAGEARSSGTNAEAKATEEPNVDVKPEIDTSRATAQPIDLDLLEEASRAANEVGFTALGNSKHPLQYLGAQGILQLASGDKGYTEEEIDARAEQLKGEATSHLFDAAANASGLLDLAASEFKALRGGEISEAESLLDTTINTQPANTNSTKIGLFKKLSSGFKIENILTGIGNGFGKAWRFAVATPEALLKSGVATGAMVVIWNLAYNFLEKAVPPYLGNNANAFTEKMGAVASFMPLLAVGIGAAVFVSVIRKRNSEHEKKIGSQENEGFSSRFVKESLANYSEPPEERTV